MLQLLLVHEDKWLLREESYLQHVLEAYGITVHQIAWEDDAPAFKALFETIVAEKPPLLWVLFLSYRVTPFHDFERPLLGHAGPPFIIPLLAGTNRFEAIFSEQFQGWWRERWEIVLRQNTSGFAGFWHVPGVPVGIISEPFRSERDFDGYLFPWLRRWNDELEPAKLFSTERALLQQQAQAVRKQMRNPRRLYALLGGAALLVAVAGSLYAQRQGRLLEALVILAALALYILTYWIARFGFSRSRDYAYVSPKGERRNVSAHQHGRGFRILSALIVLVLLILSGALLLFSFNRLSVPVRSTPPQTANVPTTSAAGSQLVASATRTQTLTPTATSTQTPQKTATPTVTATPTLTRTSTSTSTSTPTPTSTSTSTATEMPTATLTKTPQPAFAPTNTRTLEALAG